MRAMPKSAGVEMVVRYLGNQSRSNWLPFAGAFRTPATGTAGLVAREPWRFDKLFEFAGQIPAISFLERGCEADVIEQPFRIVQT